MNHSSFLLANNFIPSGLGCSYVFVFYKNVIPSGLVPAWIIGLQ